jgi:hypothetical protein
MKLEPSSSGTVEDSDCSDCGRVSNTLTRVIDPQTCSEIYLCPGCIEAFRQRLQVMHGCCDSLTP